MTAAPTTTTIEAFYLGNMSDLDPDETNYITENAQAMVGLTFGCGNDPLYNSIDALSLEDSDGGGIVQSNDNDGGDLSAEDITYSGISSSLDNVVEYNVTLTYTDGTTATTRMVILQDVSGRVFLTPFRGGNSENDVLDDHPIVSISIGSLSGDDYGGVYSDLEQDAFITCFVQGSMIETDQGVVDVADLAVGDLVRTMDHGMQPIRWIGARRVWATGNMVPIRILAGALGSGLPTRDLWVSPQHRMLLRSRIAARMFGTPEVLVAAKKLVGMSGIDMAGQGRFVTYWHILFDHHEIVFADGAASESLYLGPQAQKNIGASAVAEILELFPELAKQFEAPTSARPLVKGKKQKHLVQRHKKNAQDLFQAI